MNGAQQLALNESRGDSAEGREELESVTMADLEEQQQKLQVCSGNTSII